jgi:hypothetical protein
MNLSKWKKAALGIVGAVLLGALGSGLWDVGIKPGSRWLGNAILNVATLGSVAVKDATYREAAKGPHDAPALALLSLSLGMLMGLITVLPIITLLLQKRMTIPRRPSQHDGSDDFRAARELALEDERKTSLTFRVLYMMELLLLLTVSSVFIVFLKTAQASRAYTFFFQSMAICRPYIEEHQAQILASRFAGIQGRAEYIELITELRHIAATNQRQLPDFEPW